MIDLVSAHVTSLDLTALHEEHESASFLVQAEVRVTPREEDQRARRLVALDCGEWPLGVVDIDLSESNEMFADGGRICFRLGAGVGANHHRLAYRFNWPREGDPHGDYLCIPSALPSLVLRDDLTDVPLPDSVVVTTPSIRTTAIDSSRITVSTSNREARAIEVFNLVKPRENFSSLGTVHRDLELRASLRVLSTLSKVGVEQVLSSLAVAYEAVIGVLGGRAQGELVLVAPDDLVHNKGVEYPGALTVDADSLASDFNLAYELARQLVHLWFGGGCAVVGARGRAVLSAVGAAVALQAASLFASRHQLTAALDELRSRRIPRPWYQRFLRTDPGGDFDTADLAIRLIELETAMPGTLRGGLSRSWGRAMLPERFVALVMQR